MPPLPHDGAMSLRIAVLGLGAWGDTLAGLLRQQGHQIQGWSRRQGGDPAAVLNGADVALVAVSMAGVRELAPRLAPHWPAGLPLISCSKGIDLEALCTPSQLWRQERPDLPLLVLSQDAALLNGLRAAGVQVQALTAPDVGRRAALIGAADLTICPEGDGLQLAIASGTFTVALLGASQPETLLPPNDDKVFPLRASSGRLADITPDQILKRILGA